MTRILVRVPYVFPGRPLSGCYISVRRAGATNATGQMRTNDKPYGIEKFIAADVTRARSRKIEKNI